MNNLEDMERDARTSEFAYQVRGWLDEKFRKIDDVEQRTRELEDKISSVQRKLYEDARGG